MQNTTISNANVDNITPLNFLGDTVLTNVEDALRKKELLKQGTLARLQNTASELYRMKKGDVMRIEMEDRIICLECTNEFRIKKE
jgi:hypothetical protein